MLYDLPALIRGQPYFSLRRDNAPVMFFWDNNFINIDHSLPENLRPFDYCKSAFYAYGEQQRLEGVNIIINSNNPLWVIDLDTSSAQNDQERAFNALVLERFRGKAYIENSKTAGNYHIIGSIDPAIKQQFIAAQPAGNQSGVRLSKHLELYVGTKAISLNAYDFESHGFDGMSHMVDAQAAWAEFTNLWGYVMGQKGKGPQEARPVIDLELPEEIFEDDDIIERARYASNGAEFEYLFDTPIYDGDADKSEKDQALMNFIAFYTKNREQALRIFRSSERGERDKVTKDDRYLNRTFDAALSRLSDKEAESMEEDKAWDELILKAPAPMPAPMPTTNMPAPAPIPVTPVAPMPAESDEVLIKYETAKKLNLDPNTKVPRRIQIKPVPGALGELFDWLTASAYRPMVEAQTTTMLGLISALCGRSYLTEDDPTSTGLSNYYILLAKAGTGKSSAADLVRRLMDEIDKTKSGASELLFKMKVKSGPAFAAHISEHPTSLLMIEEFAGMFADMNNPGHHLAMLRENILEAWGSNSPTGKLSILKSSVSANTQNQIKFPAVSMWAEGVPTGFLRRDRLRVDSFDSGLYPRFLILQSTAEPVFLRPLKRKAKPPIPGRVRSVLTTLVDKALKMDACVESPDQEIEDAVTGIHLSDEHIRLVNQYVSEYLAYMRHGVPETDDYKEVTEALGRRIDAHILKISGAVAAYNFHAGDASYIHSNGVEGVPCRPRHTDESLAYARSLVLRSGKVWKEAWLGDKIGNEADGQMRPSQIMVNEVIGNILKLFAEKTASSAYRCAITERLKRIGQPYIISSMQLEWEASRREVVKKASGSKVVEVAIQKYVSLQILEPIPAAKLFEKFEGQWGTVQPSAHGRKKFYAIRMDALNRFIS